MAKRRAEPSAFDRVLQQVRDEGFSDEDLFGTVPTRRTSLATIKDEARKRVLSGRGSPDDLALLRQSRRLDVMEEESEKEARREAERARDPSEPQKDDRSVAQIQADKAFDIRAKRQARSQLTEEQRGRGETQEQAEGSLPVRALTQSVAADKDTLAMMEVARIVGDANGDRFIRQWKDLATNLEAYERAVEGGKDSLAASSDFHAITGLSLSQGRAVLEYYNLLRDAALATTSLPEGPLTTP